MKWAMISTWKMSYDGCEKGKLILEKGGLAEDAVIACIQDVEDRPEFVSVGYGGLPDEDGRVTLDAGFMDGNSLQFGAVAALEGFRSPILAARSLMNQPFNNVLTAEGAAQYCRRMGFEERDNRTEASLERWRRAKEETAGRQTLSAYDGHDTVCALAKDSSGKICAGVSTSGLFLKKHGRIGDSPLIGSGYYADSRYGAAAATGVGEDIMKGVLSFRAVMYLKEGLCAQEAADRAVSELDRDLRERFGSCRAISLIVLDHTGAYGVGTNVTFPFACCSEESPCSLYLAQPEDGHTVIQRAENPSEIEQD